MEKNKSFRAYSYSPASCSGEFELQDRRTENSYIFNGPKTRGFASSSSPKVKRKRRVAAYNVLTVEGKLKSSMMSSFKWIKNKFTG
ncbi:hypothetical protein SAY87_020741 [Trapa incisa]|uniref:Uncharacterized protein n=1 Tax=Trapa incisa TaxID=236973 RepID=A0AAN7JW69_9MYRT|nr:hypothetical protein SAY87_020741 [Trapa incisa]